MSRSEIDELLGRFVDALNALDLDAFLSLWGSDPSAILPAPTFARRCTGIDEVRSAFGALFDAMRAGSAAVSAPYLDLAPLDVDVQHLSDGAALVSFHLELGSAFGRRSLVLVRGEAGGGWRVRHLHASNVVRPDEVS